MRIQYIIGLIGIVFLMNVLAGQFHTAFDLTEDRRYTISEPVSGFLQGVDEDVNVRVFLTADFLPADFKLFKKSIAEKLDDFKAENGNISYFFEDPNKGEKELIKNRGNALRKMGVNPVRVGKDQQGKDVYVFPAAVFEGSDTVVVNLLDNDIPGADIKTVIANSIGLLEYNLTRGIQMATKKTGGIIAFTEGRGELSAGQVSDLDRSLRQQGYAVGRLPWDNIEIFDPNIDVVVIAKPRKTFSDRDKYILDQYIMQGGKVIWLIDRLTASLDSMLVKRVYTPFDYPLDIEDQLFKYGFRIQPNLVMDLECTQVKLVDGSLGNAAQMNVYPWYFHPAVRPFSDNPIVKNLDRVNLRFASVIDTIVTKKGNTEKTILLRTSDKSMVKFSPVELNFEILRIAPESDLFNKKNLPVAVLSEGEFVSAFEYNVTSDMINILKSKGMEHRTRSLPTKMLVVGDGDMARNDFDPATGNIRSLGFDRVSGYTFANKEFLLNAIEYMMDDSGIIQSKNREVKMNLLDCTRAEKEKSKWQIINIALPLLFLFAFAFIFNFIRNRRFS